MQPRWQILFSRKGIQEGLRKLRELVHIGEVRDETQRDPYSTTALHTEISKELIPGHSFFPLEKARQDFLSLFLEDSLQGLFRQVESSFASTGVTKAT